MKPGIWCWTVLFRRRGKFYTKGFYDLRRGGPEKSLAAAIAWRDEQLRKIAVLTNHELRRSLRSSNTSGEPGVLFIRSKSQPEGSWQAKIKLPDRTSVAKTFSVKKHGERGAFKLAVAAREELLKLVPDRPVLFHPTAQALVPSTKERSC
jgi:AP2 domain